MALKFEVVLNAHIKGVSQEVAEKLVEDAHP